MKLEAAEEGVEKVTGRRVTLRLGERELAALEEVRRVWGLSDDSQALREALRRSVGSRAEAAGRLADGGVVSGGTGERLTLEDVASDAAAACQTVGASVADGAGGRLTERSVLSEAVDLTALARAGALAPCVGRAEEIGQVMDVLGKRWRNGVLLVGPVGVGKSAMARGLAEVMVSGAAPGRVRGWSLVRLAAGDVRASDYTDGEGRKAVVWLTAGGAGGAEGDGAVAGPIALAQAGRHVVWEVDDRTYAGLAQRPEVEERFRVVKVAPMSREATVAVLTAHRAALEGHHGVTVTDEAVEVAAAMAQNVVEPKVLPGTAVDLLDEAASRAKRTRGVGEEARPADGPARGADGGGEGGRERVIVSAEDVAEVAARRSGTRLEQIWRR